MGALILDYDSTLVPCESLELALARAPGVDAAALAEIESVTRRGMEGDLAFAESLALRLSIARPTRGALEELGEELAARMTDGVEDVVHGVVGRGHDAWVVSGAFREVLLPAARRLGIPAERVRGVGALWHADGGFAGLDEACPANRSKVAAAEAAGGFARPAVGVGDGATDLALLDAGLVDHFIAYTEHVRREGVVSRDGPAAANMAQLRELLEPLLP